MEKEPTPQGRIRVLIQHAEPLLALGLAAALEGSEFEVFPAEGSAQTDRIDLIISDPERGLRLLAAGAQQRAHPARILIVAVALNETEIQAALRSGAHGYVLLHGGASPLKDIVSSMVRGARYLCPLAAGHLAKSLSYHVLTEREMAVLRLLVLGRPNKAIGNSLDITEDTVKAHVKSIMSKLRVKSRTEAASLAIERGLVSRSVVEAQEAAAPRPRGRVQAAPQVLSPKNEAGAPFHRDAMAGPTSCDPLR